MKMRTPALLFLRAYKASDIDVRIELVLKAFWDKSEHIDDVICAIVRVRDELSAIPVVPLLPIMHANKLLAAIDETFQSGASEISQERFVDNVLRATGWVPDAECDMRAKSYYVELLRDSVADAPVLVRSKSHSPPVDDSEFGFVIECAPQSELELFLPLQYALAALEGMILFHNKRKEMQQSNNTAQLRPPE